MTQKQRTLWRYISWGLTRDRPRFSRRASRVRASTFAFHDVFERPRPNDSSTALGTFSPKKDKSYTRVEHVAKMEATVPSLP